MSNSPCTKTPGSTEKDRETETSFQVARSADVVDRREDALCLTILAHPFGQRVGQVARLDLANGVQRDGWVQWRISREELSFRDPYSGGPGVHLEDPALQSEFRRFVSAKRALHIQYRTESGRRLVRVGLSTSRESNCGCSRGASTYHTLYASRAIAQNPHASVVPPATDDSVEAELCRSLAPVHTIRDYEDEDLHIGVVLLYCKHVGLLLHYWDDFDGDAELSAEFANLANAPVSPHGPRHAGFVGESFEVRQCRRRIQEVASSRAPVLILGETGAGKELCAQAIHMLSKRRGEWNEHNMGINATDMFNYITLFGRSDGPKKDRLNGLAIASDKGTLFLDEIANTSYQDQIALLKFLDSKEVVPLGGTARSTNEPKKIDEVDVRILVATNRPLDGLQPDFFARLSVLQLHVPPLRERRDDIGRLLYKFLRDLLTELDAETPRQGNSWLALLEAPKPPEPWLGAEIVCALAASPLRGNARDLKNLAVRMVTKYRNKKACDLLEEMIALRPAPAGQSETPPRQAADQSNWREVLNSMPRPDLIAQFEESNYELGAFAKLFGSGDAVRQAVRRRLIDVGEWKFLRDRPIDETLKILRDLQPAAGAESPSVEAVAKALRTSVKDLRGWLQHDGNTLIGSLRPEWIRNLNPQWREK